MTAITWVQERWREACAALPRRAPAPADPPEVTVPLSLVRSAKLAAWMAYFALVYFLLLYTFDIARDRAGTAHFTHVGFWTGDVRVYAPYLVGFFIVAIGIPYVAKISIPTFMSLDWRMNFWPKLWALFIAAAVSLVVIAGTFTVQGDTLLERDRESAVAVDTVAQEAAVLAARIEDVQHRLDEMTRSTSVYVQTAASMSPTAYEAWMAERRNDWQYERFRAYRQTSIDAEALRNQISELRAQQARQTVTSAVAGRVTNTSNGWIADTLGWLEGARAILLSLVMDIVCLIMPWIALRLEQTRNRQMAFAEPREFDESRAIPDLRDQPKQKPEPAYELQTKMYDEDGNELVKRRATFARKPTKGKKAQATFEGASLPDETGVAYDGGDRQATAAALASGGAMVFGESAAAEAPGFETSPHSEEISVSSNENNDVHPDLEPEGITPTPLYTDEDLFPEIAAKFSAPEGLGVGADGKDGVIVQDEEPEQYGPPAPVRQLEEA